MKISRSMVADIKFATFTEEDANWLKDYPKCEVDMGCARGHFLIGSAEKFPETCFIGVEKSPVRVYKTQKKIDKLGLTNARVFQDENGHFLNDFLSRSSVDVLHVLFADPWPKRRHHNRRLMQPPFFALAHRVVKPNGVLRFLTDDRPYFEWTSRFAKNQLGWEPLTHFEHEQNYPLTEFQRKFTVRGLAIYSMWLRRRALK
ncbi:MAG: tRNA (guanosine(46)-N7)-methyltransferase TrmB [Chthoniobacterales bacterium]